MAKASTRTAMLFNFVLFLSFLLIVFIAESRSITVGPKAKPDCDQVYGLESGDTCFAVEQFFNLTAAEFLRINPNLKCEKVFVGQWLCVSGTPN